MFAFGRVANISSGRVSIANMLVHKTAKACKGSHMQEQNFISHPKALRISSSGNSTRPLHIGHRNLPLMSHFSTQVL